MAQTLAYKKPKSIELYNAVVKTNFSTYLSFDKLLKRARKTSGLQNLGSDFWDEPLKQLLNAAINEANLSPFGAFLFREKLTGQLVNRLRAEDWFKKKPEILEQELLPVYLITGLQRTGTTRLQRLLSQQKEARGLYTWEALNPAPIKSWVEQNKRQRHGKSASRAIKWLAPDFNQIHPILPLDFEEDVLLLDIAFLSTSFEAILNVPSYSQWLTNNYNASAYAYEVKLLKLLQFKSNKAYWVLKSPHHLEFLDIFQEVVKPNKIIWTHRDINKTIPSLLSMIYYSRGLFQRDLNLHQVVEHWYPKMIEMVNKGISSAKANTKAFKHLEYDHWTKNEKGTVAEILHMPEMEVRMAEKDSFHSKHAYQMENFGLTESKIKTDFRSYFDFYEALKQ